MDLGKVDAYERKNQSRSTVLERVQALRGDEPWAGYDDQSVSEVTRRLAGADDDLRRRALEYERAHKDRAGVARRRAAARERLSDPAEAGGHGCREAGASCVASAPMVGHRASVVSSA